jgi:hypothetical protein
MPWPELGPAKYAEFPGRRFLLLGGAMNALTSLDGNAAGGTNRPEENLHTM